ncbi:hypothetical protein BREVNS_1307 [Brevinematales bacterium NS]|nr:hypothetical protein BREVNS_1307 [Brevinematales bacterium NS]
MSQRIGQEWEKRQIESLYGDQSRRYGGESSVFPFPLGYGYGPINMEFARWLQDHPESRNYGKRYQGTVETLKTMGAISEDVAKWSAIGGGVCFAGGVVCTVVPGAQPAAPVFFAASGYLFTASTVSTWASTAIYGSAWLSDSEDNESWEGLTKNLTFTIADVVLTKATKGLSKVIFKPAIQNVDDLAGIAYKNNRPYVKAGYEGVASWFGSKPGQYIGKRELQAYLEYQRELSQMATEITRQEFLRGVEAIQSSIMIGIDEWMRYKQNSNYSNIQIPDINTNMMDNYNNWKRSHDYLRYYGYDISNWKK